ncbi:DUF1905 domain-containing protein [Agromyces seonyuensis]|uniref:DUF1905 domain-containing protein n=1 Tax=Agromyces seonyuensis TaxID=2662446 RepID=A0A6I4P120_9MICO|nr:DUF1905 domain-containing protein [Agromyces seonyuensis]MWC00289.1 DUF1905 domain-containing protein [Agromyces seonyuensis]
MTRAFAFEADLYEWSARRGWYMVDLPEDVSDAITAIPLPPKGFGSVKVRASVGGTTWDTSIFPGSDRYILVIGKAVRTAEGIEPGDRVSASVEIVGT